jgi:hypothetical protein
MANLSQILKDGKNFTQGTQGIRGPTNIQGTQGILGIQGIQATTGAKGTTKFGINYIVLDQ